MVKDMEYIWDENREDVLFFGNVYDLEELHSVLNNCHDVLKKSESAREMVLETWLSLDFAIRQFLLAGFDLSRFCDEEFDLKYMLLPRNFGSLLDVFKDTIRYNLQFSLKPDPVQTDDIGGFRTSFTFLKYVKEKHSELFNRIIDVEREYVIYKHPELKGSKFPKETLAALSIESIELKQKRPLEKMELGWRKIASRFDESWFKLAAQLNKARNEAAHSTNTDKIGARFGLVGPHMLENIRGKCLAILNVLLAVKTDSQ